MKWMTQPSRETITEWLNWNLAPADSYNQSTHRLHTHKELASEAHKPWPDIEENSEGQKQGLVEPERNNKILVNKEIWKQQRKVSL